MSIVRLEPPEKFNFAKPDEWPRWWKRYLQYRSASGLATEDVTRQVDTLLYCMGEEADSVLSSTDITAEQRQDHAAVLSKLDSYFEVRRNVVFERARFNGRTQREGESVEQFITELYRLAEFCSYGPLKEMIRDRIVVGIRDPGMSEKLQTDPDLTLEKAKKLVRQKEAAREHRRELQQEVCGVSKPRCKLSLVGNHSTSREEPTKPRAKRTCVHVVGMRGTLQETDAQQWELPATDATETDTSVHSASLSQFQQ